MSLEMPSKCDMLCSIVDSEKCSGVPCGIDSNSYRKRKQAEKELPFHQLSGAKYPASRDRGCADAGLGRGIIVTAVNRHPITNAQEFKREMSQAADKPVLLTVNTGGQTAFIVVQPK